MNHLPRIGENITLDFLKAKVGINFFYVEDIRYEFVLQKQIVFLMLKGGTYNSYWYHRKHKALELREIGFMDDFKLNDYEIKKILGRNY